MGLAFFGKCIVQVAAFGLLTLSFCSRQLNSRQLLYLRREREVERGGYVVASQRMLYSRAEVGVYHTIVLEFYFLLCGMDVDVDQQRIEVEEEGRRRMAVAGEEFGVFLCVLIVGLFAFLVLRALTKAMKEENLFVLLASDSLKRSVLQPQQLEMSQPPER